MRGSPESATRACGVTVVTGVAALAAEYDGCILDQWGVLHDGTRPYPGAAECLRALREAGRRIVVLSNSGRREAHNLRLMASMGFEPALIDRFVSGGEDARRALETRQHPFHRALGRRCHAFTRAGDRSLLEGIGLELVDRVEEADFLAVLGTDAPRRLVKDYEPELQRGLARGLPMVCANPDIVRLLPEGTTEAQGALARRYEALGGNVFYHGKPYPAIYHSCLEALGCEKGRIIAIGDSLEHDILGAARVGIRSALIPGGVHASELGISWGELPAPEKWRAFSATADAQPDYLLAAFNW
ncbi:MAG: TIGR01459 family HAD-type hydrolase [Betaproteobacteria bacterium]